VLTAELGVTHAVGVSFKIVGLGADLIEEFDIV
jgi:hypothetical protein